MNWFLFILGGAIISFGLVLLKYCMAHNRAKKQGVIGYKRGLVVNKGGSLVATYTEVYRDPKTGENFFGKTKFGTIDRFGGF